MSHAYFIQHDGLISTIRQPTSRVTPPAATIRIEEVHLGRPSGLALYYTDTLATGAGVVLTGAIDCSGRRYTPSHLTNTKEAGAASGDDRPSPSADAMRGNGHA